MTRDNLTQTPAEEAETTLMTLEDLTSWVMEENADDVALRIYQAEAARERLQKREAAMLHWVHFAQNVYADNPDFLGALSAIEFVAVPKPLTDAEIKRGQEIEAEITSDRAATRAESPTP